MKSILVSVVIGMVLISLALTQVHQTPEEVVIAEEGANVSVVDGVQIIAIDAKGGYRPLQSRAQSGIETVLRFNTSATFDCSAAVRIPSLDISKTLPQSGSTDIAIGVPQPGLFRGSCSMGMYPFEVFFE